MKEISLKELEQEHQPKYRIEYWMPNEPFHKHRECWNPLLCREFIRELSPKHIIKIYKY